MCLVYHTESGFIIRRNNNCDRPESGNDNPLLPIPLHVQNDISASSDSPYSRVEADSNRQIGNLAT